MATVGAFEAKTHLSALLDRVAKGETIEITKRGVPVAKLVPVATPGKQYRREVGRQIRELSEGIALGDVSLRELMHEGHRY